MKHVSIVVLVLGLATQVGAGEWHSGTNNLCSDCHTMHFSMQHNWDGSTPVPTTPAANGNWLSTTGPNDFLLKAPANELCLACHNGQGFAPDVLGVNFNAAPTQGRSAGALNDEGGLAGGSYHAYAGHTLDSTAVPPGFDPVLVGAPATWYDPAGGLECVSCHAQHGPVTAYRNLGPYALGGAAAAARPTYAIGTVNDTTKDVWINVTAPYVPNTGAAATFNPYYDSASVSFNNVLSNAGTTHSNNRIDNLCAACHGKFHGGASDVEIQGSATLAALDGFARHPTSEVVIGAAGAQGYGGHSSLSRFVANTTKTKVYASDRVGFTDATPGCVSCHKAHGNLNPFGLVFLNRSSTTVDEEGGWDATQPHNLQQGYRNLCGQCHGQGN